MKRAIILQIRLILTLSPPFAFASQCNTFNAKLTASSERQFSVAAIHRRWPEFACSAPRECISQPSPAHSSPARSYVLRIRPGADAATGSRPLFGTRRKDVRSLRHLVTHINKLLLSWRTLLIFHIAVIYFSEIIKFMIAAISPSRSVRPRVRLLHMLRRTVVGQFSVPSRGRRETPTANGKEIEKKEVERKERKRESKKRAMKR